jgi:hypothetical protein
MRSFYRLEIRKAADDPLPRVLKTYGDLIIDAGQRTKFSCTPAHDAMEPFHEWFNEELNAQRHLNIHDERAEKAWKGVFSIETIGEPIRISSIGPIENISED